MSALPNFEPIVIDVVEIEEIDGQQILRLPSHLHINAQKLQVIRSGTDVTLRPLPAPLSGEALEQWKADMQAFQDELGDLFPEGRNQPPMPPPWNPFPEDD